MLNHFGSILLADNLLGGFWQIAAILAALLFVGIIVFIARTYKKVPQGMALVRNGVGGTKVIFDGGFVLPVIHQYEMMDVSVRSIEIQREGKNGLICKDNLRADIKVAFFVRVNPNDVAEVAQSIGCSRASDEKLLETLFEAKFSEGLKTVGKQFDFVELYTSREQLNTRVRHAIGTNLNGYVLEDMAIDYLEQTPLEFLDANNILDSEGIKKITSLTANQKVQSNLIRNDEIKQIKQQDVERQEAVYELERQQAEAEAKQKREISIVQSREEAESEKVMQEERLKGERARITADEEIGIAEENKTRQIIVAQKSRETTDAVETEKVERERALEINERERVVELARISKEKAVEEERRNIQDVIRERVEVERAVVEEEEKIKDTKAFSAVEREKTVAIKLAEKDAEESLVKELKAAEAAKDAAKFKAEQSVIQAEAEMKSSESLGIAKKTMADANAAEIAAQGLAEAQVLEALAEAEAKKGEAEATVIEAKAEAEAKGIEMRGDAQSKSNEKIGLVDADLIIKKGLAEADVRERSMLAEAVGMTAQADAQEKYGLAEAKVMEKKALVEAGRIRAEALAMKEASEATTEMEKFRLNLSARKEIELSQISVQKDLAEAQGRVLAEALKSANIDIIGGETMFFENIMNAVAKGKTIDGYVKGSEVLSDLKDNLLGDGSQPLTERISGFIKQFGLTTEDVKNLTVANLLMKLSDQADDKQKSMLGSLMETVKSAGIGGVKVDKFL